MLATVPDHDDLVENRDGFVFALQNLRGHILAAGGSGTDEDTMRGNTLAVVVSNRHEEELERLADTQRIYFATRPYAAGIMEAIAHYDFLSACRVPEAEETVADD